MKRVLVDTGGFFALYSANDLDHARAVEVFRQANSERWQLVTTLDDATTTAPTTTTNDSTND